MGNPEPWSLLRGEVGGVRSGEDEPWGSHDLVVAWTSASGSVTLQPASARYFVTQTPFPSPGVHASDWLVRSLEHLPLGVRRSGELFDLPPLEFSDKEHETTSLVLRQLGLERPVAVHPGAGGAWKRWPPERFAGLVREMGESSGEQVVLIEGPADEDVIQATQQALLKHAPVLRGLSLRMLGAALSHCSVFVGNDSGVTHLAAAAGVPTIALFGPTDPASWAPPRADVIRKCDAVARKQGQIRVCFDEGCMGRISVDEVVQSLQSLLRRSDQVRGRGREATPQPVTDTSCHPQHVDV